MLFQVMLLDNGHIAEFDKYVFYVSILCWMLIVDPVCRPSVLLGNSTSKFYSLCKATGREEFAMLKKMAGV
jgi:hypothetical protein